MPGRWELIADADDKGWTTISLTMDSDLLAKMLSFQSGWIYVESY